MDRASNACVLIVEDELVNRELLTDLVRETGFDPVAVVDGETAWQRLQDDAADYVAVLLDRMLPGIDGIEVLRRIKSDPRLQHLPVIMQTSMNAPEDVREGLSAGAYYYLTKPVDPDALVAIVGTATRDLEQRRGLEREAHKTLAALAHLRQAEFQFRTPQEARDIAVLLGSTCPKGRKLVLGLTELMLNAVEHGNLGISYQDKTRLIASGRLQDEIQQRLTRPGLRERRARLHFSLDEHELRFLVSDEGVGFDWEPFLEISPERAFDTHGRGIAMAGKISFDSLEYQGCGNRVLARLSLDPSKP